MSRDPRLYLEDIREHCEEIAEHVRGMSYDEFLADRTTYKAVSYSLLVIGEAAKHLPTDMRVRTAEVEWRKIAGLRDHLAHGYFSLDDRIVWDAATASVPELRVQVQRILEGLG